MRDQFKGSARRERATETLCTLYVRIVERTHRLGRRSLQRYRCQWSCRGHRRTMQATGDSRWGTRMMCSSLPLPCLSKPKSMPSYAARANHHHISQWDPVPRGATHRPHWGHQRTGRCPEACEKHRARGSMKAGSSFAKGLWNVPKAPLFLGGGQSRASRTYISMTLSGRIPTPISRLVFLRREDQVR